MHDLFSRSCAALVVVIGLSGSSPAAEPAPGAALFASDKVLPVRIEIAPADLESLRKEPREYVSATVWADKIVCSNVAVHLKAQSR